MDGLIAILERMLQCLLPLYLMFAPAPASAYTELHAHLFMDEAMTWVFSGDFNSPLRAKDWRDRVSSQANVESVTRSGLRILVASLYAHPLLRLDMRQAVRDQIKLAERFVATTPGWIIAHSGAEAERAIRANQNVIVLSLEGALGVIETEEDIEEFVVRRGIRIVTPLHLTDDRFGGVSFLRPPLTIFNPLAMIRQLLHPRHDEEGVRINDRGLTEQGRKLIHRLIDRGAWIDLAHASDQSAAEMIPILEARHLPLLYTHTIVRKFHGAERGIPQSQLDAVARTSGVVGLMPAADYLNGTPEPAGLTCHNRSDAFIEQYRYLAARLGAPAVMVGSDTNGAVAHLPPACSPGESVNSVEREGYWNIGQSRDLWTWLVKRQVAPFSAPDATVRRFIEAWKRVDAARTLVANVAD